MKSDIFYLNPDYSTTRNLFSKNDLSQSVSNKIHNDISYEKKDKPPKLLGGLRTNGYYKKSFSKKPLITVVTVVRNGFHFIEHAIRSVIHQTYDNVEYIIIDGGSNDGTLDIISRYNHAIDYWISEKDNGIYDAMNKAIMQSTGEWVFFLGADDILVQFVLDKIPFHSYSDLDAIYGDVFFTDRHFLYDGKFSKLKIIHRNICHQAIFYNANVLNRKFDLKYKILADYEMNLYLFSRNRLKYLPVLVSLYNDTGYSAQTKDLVFEKDRALLIKKYFGYKYFLIWRILLFLYNLVKFIKIEPLMNKLFRK